MEVGGTDNLSGVIGIELEYQFGWFAHVAHETRKWLFVMSQEFSEVARIAEMAPPVGYEKVVVGVWLIENNVHS